MKRAWLYLSLVVVLGGLLSWRVHSLLLISPLVAPVSAQEPPAGQTASCRISNNLAAPSGNTAEAPYSLVLLQRGGGNAAAVIAAINGGTNVIVRLGAGEGKLTTQAEIMAEADAYVNALRQIRAATGSKPFIVTATHNEPNCAENYPNAFATEPLFAQRIIGSGLQNVTFISGQIDYLCGDFEKRGDRAPADYIRSLSSIPGISGIALPFYTGDAGSSGAMVGLFNQHADIARGAGKKIFVTESGPYKRNSGIPSKEEFADYVNGVKQVEGNVEVLLLFNALGLNGDSNFAFTKFFHKAKCREAFRNQCQNVDAVVAACFGEISDKDEYYLYPIKGILNQSGTQLYQDLVNQGYQASCTVPFIDIKAADNLDRGNGFLMSQIDDEAKVEIQSEMKYDYSNAEWPLWREGGAVIISDEGSLESYWGRRDTSEKDPFRKDLASAPLYRLLTLDQQCKLQRDMLETIEKKCNKLIQPESCALDIDIKGIKKTFTALELKQAIEANNLSCEVIKQATPPSGMQASDFEEYKMALANVPLYMPTAYRLAFLVIAAEYKGIPEVPAFNFLNLKKTPFQQPAQSVRVIAFKIPDIGTNRDPADETTYQDPLQITRDALITKERQEANDRAANERRQITRTKPSLALSEPLINCKDDSEAKPGDSNNCDDLVVKTLVDFVNNRIEDPTDPEATSVACTGVTPASLEYEESSEISDNTGLPLTDGAKHNLGDQAGDTLASLFKSGASNALPPKEEGTSVKPFKFLSQYWFKKEGPRTSGINAYLVYPQGYELHTVEKALLGAVYTPDQISEMLASPELKQYFKLNETGQEYPESKGILGRFLKDPFCPADIRAKMSAGPEPATEAEINAAIENECKVEIAATVYAQEANMTTLEPRIIGGQFGFVTRKIQLALNRFNTRAYECIDSIKTTEDLLLGRCGGNSTKPLDMVGPSELSNSCKDEYQSKVITVYDTRETFKLVMAAAAQYNVDPNLLWGIFRIEGGKYRRDMDKLAPGTTASINCIDTINRCGAVGPMQLIQGMCATTACGAYESLKNIQRNGDLCSFEGSISVAAQKISADKGVVGNDPYRLAGRYHGLPVDSLGPKCDGAAEVSGCGSMNYCQCAVEGFDDEFQRLQRSL